MQSVIVGFILSSLFYQLKGSNYRNTFGALFMCCMFMAMGAMPVLAIAIAGKG